MMLIMLLLLLLLLLIRRRCSSAYNAITANAYIAMMLISSGVLIIKYDDAYNTAIINVII